MQDRNLAIHLNDHLAGSEGGLRNCSIILNGWSPSLPWGNSPLT